MKTIGKLLLMFSVLFCVNVSSFAQITAGKIVYEGKTNFYKKIKWGDWKERVKT